MKKIWSTGLLRNKLRSYFSKILLGVFLVPLGQEGEWKSLSFRKINPNRVQHENSRLHIQVQSSAGPLIHKFKNPRVVKKIKIKGRWTGKLKLTGAQGEKGQDDFLLRVGLVRAGDKTLNFVQRKIAPQWILEMHKLAPKGVGVSHIDFLCIYHDKKLAGQSRPHPLSDLLKEHFVWEIEKEGEFEFEHEFSAPQESLALWLSSDGDDTGSNFHLEIEQLEIE